MYKVVPQVVMYSKHKTTYRSRNGRKLFGVRFAPELPIGYVGLSLGPQDPRGPPANCGTHIVDCRYMIRSTIIRQNFMP